MWTIFLKNKSIETTQNNFYFILEKIVKVALSKTKRNDNQSVIDILDNIKEVFDKFWDLKQKNPKKFDELFWDYNFFKDYVQPLNNNSNTSDLAKDVSYRLAFNSKRELKGITLFIESYKKNMAMCIKIRQ